QPAEDPDAARSRQRLHCLCDLLSRRRIELADVRLSLYSVAHGSQDSVSMCSYVDGGRRPGDGSPCGSEGGTTCDRRRRLVQCVFGNVGIATDGGEVGVAEVGGDEPRVAGLLT